MYDLAIIGGGVNGCGIARDAAGRGLSVLLCEKGDLASGTSSASTKLIHGGLRYLEHYEFRLVRESLSEREVLLKLAPHIVRPLRFVLPHHAGLRPAALIRLGLFLYDHLGGRRLLPASRGLDLKRDPAGAPLKPTFTRGFEYSDCWVDDARLVVLNAVDAAARGAAIRVRVEVTSATRQGDRWRLTLTDRLTGARSTEEARVLVNAAGPWVGEVLSQRLGLVGPPRVRLVKGSHIVVPRLFDHERAYIFQNADRRVVFAIPYEQDFTLIGTTDVDYAGDLTRVEISPEEVDYLCQAASVYFTRAVRPADVVWSYAGVRSLPDDGGAAQELSRDFVLELDGGSGEPPLLSIIGGKITTYRRLAEAALRKLAPWLKGAGPAWTHRAPLPGGDLPAGGTAQLARELQNVCPAMGAELADRLARTYGSAARGMFSGALGQRFGADLHQPELEHLLRSEWAVTAEDVLWRRTKLGLRFSAAEARSLDEWMQANRARILASAA